MAALLTTNLGQTPLVGRGKVRDLYAVNGALLLVATDRISAFDHVLGTGIPDKGKILTQISLFWFDLLKDVVPNHLITADVDEFPTSLLPYRDQLQGRSMLVKRADMFPVECVARGYLAGSGWKEYRAEGTVCGTPLPGGLLDGSRLPEPIFTPATKSQDGAHDENISYDKCEAIVGAAEAAELRSLTLAIYGRAAGHAEACGLILADTKFEFGKTPEGVILADEVLTPDSRVSGTARPGSRVGHSHRLTSNSYAITWKKSTGTNRRRRRVCRTTWWSARGPSILKPSGV